MREVIVSGIGTVRYPDEVAFAFNPNRVTVWTDKDVTFTVGTTIDVREPMSGKLEFDMSVYLQAMVSKDERMKGVSVSVSTDDGAFLFDMLVVWGAMNVGERWNAPYELRWWKGLPFTMELYIPTDTVQVRSRYDREGYVSEDGLPKGYVNISPEEKWPDATDNVVLRVDEGETSGVWDWTFDGTFSGVDAEKVRLYRLKVQDEDECGIYLRWVDRHGWLRYWLFKEGQRTTEGKALEALRGIHEDGQEYRVSRFRGKEVSRQVRLCAPLVTDDELDVLEHLASSPVVDMWTGTGWLPVNVGDVSVVRGGKEWRPLNDFECVMVYPEVMTQRL